MILKSKVIIVAITALLLGFCNSEPEPIDLSGTKWVYRFNPDIADSLILSDSLYVNYRAEIGMRYYGRYYIQKDTLFFERIGEIWMYDPPKYVPTVDNMNTKARAIINKEGKLQYISPIRYENGRWHDTNIEFGEYAILKRVE